MAVDPPRGPGLHPLPVQREPSDNDDTELFYETPSIPETTEERSDTTEILRPRPARSGDTTEILPRESEPLPPRIPQLPPVAPEPPRRPKPPPSRLVPLLGVGLAALTGLALLVVLALLVALGA